MSSVLKDHFFSIGSLLQTEEGIADAVIELNADHPIFRGHFPGRPIVPGACLLQMMKELVASLLAKEIIIVKANQIKFIAPVDPVKNPTLNLHLQYTTGENNTCQLTAMYSYDHITCCKINAVIKIV